MIKTTYHEIARIDHLGMKNYKGNNDKYSVIRHGDGRIAIFDIHRKRFVVRPHYYLCRQGIDGIIELQNNCALKTLKIANPYELKPDSETIFLSHRCYKTKVTHRNNVTTVSNTCDVSIRQKNTPYIRVGIDIYDEQKREFITDEPEDTEIYFKSLTNPSDKFYFCYCKSGRQYTVYRVYPSYGFPSVKKILQFECDRLITIHSIHLEDNHKTHEHPVFKQITCIVEENGQIVLRKINSNSKGELETSDRILNCSSVYKVTTSEFLLKRHNENGLLILNPDTGEIITEIEPINSYIQPIGLEKNKIYCLFHSDGKLEIRSKFNNKLLQLPNYRDFEKKGKTLWIYLNQNVVNGVETSIIIHENELGLVIQVANDNSKIYQIEEDKNGNIRILLNGEEVDEIELPKEDKTEVEEKPKVRVRKITKPTRYTLPKFN